LYPSIFADWSLVTGIAAVTVAAIDRSGAVRLEGDSGDAATSVAGYFEHWTVFAVSLFPDPVLSLLAADGASRRFVGKTFLGEKFLFAFGKLEGLPTLFTLQQFALEQ